MKLKRRHWITASIAHAWSWAQARPAMTPAASTPSSSADAAPQHPRMPLATLWSDALDPAQYLVSEKLDGVRGLWDGARLRFRSGRPVMAPRWFTDRMPDAPLDGELWMGRGRFDALASCVRKSVPVPAEWRDVRFMVFELPDAPGPFAERARQIEQRVAQARWATLGAVTQRPVADREALRRELAATLARGGEGLMLHRSDAPYQAGRSEFLRKLKPTLDAEAQVVAHLPGQGRLSGLLGALALRTPQGVEFRVGTGLSDATRRNPPALGSRVTYRYRDLTPAGVPRFASYLRAHAEL